MRLERVSPHLARCTTACAVLSARQRELEPAHAFEYFSFARRGGERQPHARLVGIAHVKRRSGHIDHVLFDRALDQICGMTAALQPRPDHPPPFPPHLIYLLRAPLPPPA